MIREARQAFVPPSFLLPNMLGFALDSQSTLAGLLALLPLILVATTIAPLLFFAAFFFFVAVVKSHSDHARIPDGLSWMGKNDQEWFSALRANWRGWFESIPMYMEGYKKFSKDNKIFVVPTWTRAPQILLPPSMASWLAAQPEHIVSAKDRTFNAAQFKYTVGHPEILKNDMVELIIKRELTKTVGTLNEDIIDEILSSMDSLYGTDGEWRECYIFDSLTRTVGRVVNRVFVGKELCQNMEYVMAGTRFAKAVNLSSYVLHLFPEFCKPAVAALATLPNKYQAYTCMKHLQPLIAQRITDMRAKDADPTYPWEEPNEYVSWLVRESFKRTSELDTSVYNLSYRIVMLNFAAIITTTISCVNTVLDVWSAHNAEEIVEEIREEILRVLSETNGVWTKAAVAKMYRLDSAIRESSRINGVGGTSLARQVRVPEGIKLPNGLVAPQHTTIGVSMDGIHMDPDNYPDPMKFDPFRFSRERENGGKPKENVDLSTTSSKYVLFSHGVHACPARFFATNDLKLILGHLILNYEIAPRPRREPNISLGDIAIVPESATIKIRRRLKA
ncbi:cytochrome P450 [Mycena amicta]|nr:cytochrome P450 [Mycena amicta]